METIIYIKTPYEFNEMYDCFRLIKHNNLPIEIIEEIGQWCDIDTKRAMGLLPGKVTRLLDQATINYIDKTWKSNKWYEEFGFIKAIKGTSRCYIILKAHQDRIDLINEEKKDGIYVWKKLETHKIPIETQ